MQNFRRLMIFQGMFFVLIQSLVCSKALAIFTDLPLNLAYASIYYGFATKKERTKFAAYICSTKHAGALSGFVDCLSSNGSIKLKKPLFDEDLTGKSNNRKDSFGNDISVHRESLTQANMDALYTLVAEYQLHERKQEGTVSADDEKMPSNGLHARRYRRRAIGDIMREVSRLRLASHGQELVDQIFQLNRLSKLLTAVRGCSVYDSAPEAKMTLKEEQTISNYLNDRLQTILSGIKDVDIKSKRGTPKMSDLLLLYRFNDRNNGQNSSPQNVEIRRAIFNKFSDRKDKILYAYARLLSQALTKIQVKLQSLKHVEEFEVFLDLEQLLNETHEIERLVQDLSTELAKLRAEDQAPELRSSIESVKNKAIAIIDQDLLHRLGELKAKIPEMISAKKLLRIGPLPTMGSMLTADRKNKLLWKKTFQRLRRARSHQQDEISESDQISQTDIDRGLLPLETVVKKKYSPTDPQPFSIQELTLFDEQEESADELKRADNFPFGYGHAAARGFRPAFEDHHVVDSFVHEGVRISFGGIFDGHGQQPNGHRISTAAGAILKAHLLRHLFPETKPETEPKTEEEKNAKENNQNDHQKKLKNPVYVYKILKNVFATYDAAIKEHLAKEYSTEEISRIMNNQGSTLVVFVTIDKDLYLANLGDSRAVFVGPNGETVRLTADHKPTKSFEQRRIQQDGGTVELVSNSGIQELRLNGKFSVSRGLGDLRVKGLGKNADILVFPSYQKHFKDGYLTLLCDGVTDLIDDASLGRYIHSQLKDHSENLALSQTAYNVIASVFQLGLPDPLYPSRKWDSRKDNLSLAIFKFRK